MFKNLEQLTKKIKKQKNKNPNISYTASLFKKGKYNTKGRAARAAESCVSWCG